MFFLTINNVLGSSTEHLWLPAEYPLKESSTNYKARRQSGHRISYRFVYQNQFTKNKQYYMEKI